MASHSPHPDDPRPSLWFVLQETFWIFALAAIAGFVFLLLVGAFTIGEMWKPALVLVVLAAGWLAHAVRVHRTLGAREEKALHRIRERRGF